MTRGILWKEIREQGTILAALVVLGCAVLIGGAIVLDPGDGGRATELRSLANAGRLALVMLALTAGVVVGGTLFAGEREAGTFTFLDQLPAARWSVWWRKVLAGAGMVAVATAAFLAASVATGLLSLVVGRGGFLAWVFLIGAIAFAAYGWGVFGSVISRTSLAACGTGLGLATALGFLLFVVLGVALIAFRRQFPSVRLFSGQEHNAWELAFQVAGYVLVAVPVPAAAVLYTAPDRARRFADLTARLPGLGGVVRAGMYRASGLRWAGSFRRLLWLSTRQGRGSALALVVAGLVAGITLAPADSIPFVIWPILTLLAGVLAGVVGLADEQNSGAFRFWGERRMPTGRLWLAKVAYGAGLTLAMLVAALVVPLLALVAGERGRGPLLAAVFRTSLFDEPGFPFLCYLFVWPVYGFACGHLAALLFRKTVVAAAVAVLTSGTLAGLWFPSLLSGGLHLWQVFAPAAAILLTARLLVWPWATDRLGTRRALSRLAVGSAAALAVAGGAITYRVAEVPVVAEVEEDLEFSRELPSFDEKQAGRDLRRAVGSFSTVDPITRAANPEGRPTMFVRDDGTAKRSQERVARAIAHGWPANDRELDAWLDGMFAVPWDEPLRAIVARPIGVLEDPNEYTLTTQYRYAEPIRSMTVLLLARAVREQVRGNPAALPEALGVCFPVIRTARNKTFAHPTTLSFVAEQSAYEALDRWLERLAGRPDLLRAALALVLEHDRTDPFDPQAVQLAHQTLMRNVLLAPSRALPRFLDDTRPGVVTHDILAPTSAAADTETALIAFAWAVPWEQERLRRVVGLTNRPGRWREQREWVAGAPGLLVVSRPDPGYRRELDDAWKQVVAARRAAALKLAARLHEEESGGVPRRLTDLVPKYLSAVPADPFDGRPFRYRVSRGETIEREPDPRDESPNFGMPPGTAPPFLLGTRQYQAVAALAGGLVCWPQDPGPYPADDTPRPGPGGPVAPRGPWIPRPPMPGAENFDAPPPLWVRPVNPKSRVQETVPAGQGILWSVGPDGSDDGGTAEPMRAAGISTGDLVYVIPRPARPEKTP